MSRDHHRFKPLHYFYSIETIIRTDRIERILPNGFYVAVLSSSFVVVAFVNAVAAQFELNCNIVIVIIPPHSIIIPFRFVPFRSNPLLVQGLLCIHMITAHMLGITIQNTEHMRNFVSGFIRKINE